MDSPKITKIAANTPDIVEAAGTRGWFLAVPDAVNGTLTMDNSYNGSGDVLFFQQITGTGISTPGQPIPLPYDDGLYCTVVTIGATVYTWPGETVLHW